MSEILKTVVRALVQTIFEIVTDKSTSEHEKIARLTRASEALASETAADKLIEAALK